MKKLNSVSVILNPIVKSFYLKTLKNSLLIVILFLMGFSFQVNAQRKVEKLGRGVVAVNKGGGSVYVSWRLLASDPEDISFNLYRSINGGAAVKVNSTPIVTTTDYTDNSASTSYTNSYYVKPVINSTEQAASGSFTINGSSTGSSYFTIQLQPLTGYSVNHIYVGDLNGDGEYDFVVKRFPADPANNVIIEAYLNKGTYLWRVNLGRNIEQGNSAYNPITLVHDFDCDGKAEVMIRSGEGTIFSNGDTIPDMNGDGITDYRTFPPIGALGYMLLGDNCPEFMSMVNGMTGVEITRTNYIDRGPKANWMALWGDDYGHRMNMNFCGVAYLDGIHPSIIVSRGDGGIMDVEAFDYLNSTFTSRWTWSARTNTALTIGKTWRQFHNDWVNTGAQITGIPTGYHWADFHNIRVVDLDGDGKDEISWGVNAMDDNGKPLYFAKNDIGHGDRFVTADIDPDRPGLETYAIQQTNSVLAVYYDAKTGERIKTFSTANPFDVGRGDVADIDPRYKGMELWSYAHAGLLNCKGTQIAPSFPHPALSIWWDGDLQRENLDAAGKEGYNPIINKWNYTSSAEDRLFSLYNEGGSYSTQCPYAGRVPLYGDIMGDWREEIVLNNSNNTEIRIFSTSTPAPRRLYCLMQNPEYRNCINLKAYLPSTEVDYYLGQGMTNPPMPPMLDMKRQWKGGINGNVWDINATKNWISNNDSSIYLDNDSVMFDINGAGNTSVQLLGDLSPAFIVVNSPINYVFGGTGKITGSTKLIKSGKGALTIAANCDYTGATKVEEGTLYVDSVLFNSAVTINWHATIGGKGKIVQPLTIARGSIIVPGTISTVDSLTFGSGLTLPGENICTFDITDDSTGLIKPSDKIKVMGDLVISDTTFFKLNKINGTVKPGLYPLINYSGIFSGSLKKISLSGLFGQKTVLKDSINTIWLEVIASRGSGKVVWSGDGKDWDLLTTPNWLYNGVNDIFASNDSVVFNEIGSGQYMVNLVGDLPIRNMTVETTNNNYYFSGTGVIGGTGGLTKNGNGILSIANTTNTYTGKTVINNGTFIIGGLNNAGLNSSIGASTSTAPSNIVFNSAKVKYLFSIDTYTDRGVTLSGTQDTIEVGTSGKVLTLSGVLAGTAKLVKTGAGTLYLSNNANSYTGGTIIKGGLIQINDPSSTIGALGSGLVTLDGGALTMGSSNGYTTCNSHFYIPGGSIGTLSTDLRCNYYGTLTGGGTLNLNLPGTIDRTIFFGDWSAFVGTINVSGNSFRLATTNYTGSTINLASGVSMYHSTGTSGGDAVATTVNIGALSGVSGSYLNGENWVIGAKNTNTTFAGTISGNSLTKVGTGTLTLSGINTYTGGTTMNAGKILISGSSNGFGTGLVNINNTAILAGTGTIKAPISVNSGGTIAAGNTFGSLLVNNNVTFKSGSILAINVISTTNTSSKLYVVGSFKLILNGTLQLTELNGASYSAGNSFTIISGSNISGNFTSIMPATPGDGLVWDTTSLRSDGVIKVALETKANELKSPTLECTLFPNPSDGKVYISCSKEMKNSTISIETIKGTFIMVKKMDILYPNTEIDLSGLPQGVYLMRISSGNAIVLKKIIKN